MVLGMEYVYSLRVDKYTHDGVSWICMRQKDLFNIYGLNYIYKC